MIFRLLSLSLITVLCAPSLFSQVSFWTEDFGSGCDAGLLATAYSGPNGTWTSTSTGSNASEANVWYVSATENGMQEGECGAGCGSDRTLHLGAVDVGVGADLGAAYYEGIAAFCNFFPCGATDKRIESPTINCSGYTNVTVTFLYIEGGNAIDNATFWYYNGTTWSQISDMAKTFSALCSPQGLWTEATITLPASADNNPSVKIGFRWINNDDGDATDPSFAVDDIVVSGNSSAGDTTPPVLECISNTTLEISGGCAAVLPNYLAFIEVTDNTDPNPVLVQSPEPGTLVANTTMITVTATDASGNSSSCSFEVSLLDIIPPTISCPQSVLVQVAAGETSADVAVGLATASDNCGTPEVINSFTGTADASGNYPLGSTVVTFTATDDAGNQSDCTMTVTVTSEECCPPDLNCDGFIGVADLLIFNANFGCSNGCPGDIDGDGLVAVSDLLIFTGAFGTYCP